MNRFQCVADLQRRYGVKRLCGVLGVSRSSFYYWRRTAADRADRQAADAQSAARIRAVHQELDGTYGVPGITAELRETSGEAVNHKRVGRIMRASGIEGIRLRRRHRTTAPDPDAAKAPDLIRRDLTADKPNTKYVGDITYLPIDGGKFCHLATVIDLASRRLAGWAIADHMRADLVTDALAAAIRTRGSLAGSIDGGTAPLGDFGGTWDPTPSNFVYLQPEPDGMSDIQLWTVSSKKVYLQPDVDGGPITLTLVKVKES
ncbi:IS3 family transposase [Streptomyces hydrogenans]|uniref:IS3 family transposase n=1 Tax=Streptomyces hydrogenans TaxID=1873719 RepID=UPI0035DCD84C